MAKNEKQQSGRMPVEVSAIDLLSRDHREVEQLFDQFKKMTEKGEKTAQNGMSKRDLVKKACAMLTVHAQIEEEIFYPALRKALDEDDLLNEAQVEHNSAKQLIAELQSMRANDKLHDATFTVLGEYVRHHVREEEQEMFKEARKSEIDLDDLGKRLMKRKRELMEEHGLEMEEDD